MTSELLKRLGLIGALSGTLAFGGCSSMGMAMHEQTWTMNTTPRVQAAQGQVKVAAEKNGNTRLKLEVEHLAPPAAVFDHAETYVVWLQPPTGLPQNVGVLAVGNDLKGKLETSTAFKNFKVLVTAENSAGATIPSGRQIMDANVSMPT